MLKELFTLQLLHLINKSGKYVKREISLQESTKKLQAKQFFADPHNSNDFLRVIGAVKGKVKIPTNVTGSIPKAPRIVLNQIPVPAY